MRISKKCSAAHCIYSNHNTPDAIVRYQELIDAGVPSIKIFPTDIRAPAGWQNSLTPIAKIDLGRLEHLRRQIARHSGVLAVHGEDDELVMYNYLLAQQRGHWGRPRPDWPKLRFQVYNIFQRLDHKIREGYRVKKGEARETMGNK